MLIDPVGWLDVTFWGLQVGIIVAEGELEIKGYWVCLGWYILILLGDS